MWEVRVKNWLNTLRQLDSMTILNSWNTWYTPSYHAENLSTQLLENRPPIKVLIISNFDHAISLTFVDMLSYFCNNRFTFDIWDELKTSPEILNQTDYDIIVSNFYIPGITKKSICSEIICQSYIWLIILTPYNEIYLCNLLYKLSKKSIIVLTFFSYLFSTSFLQTKIPVGDNSSR